MRFVRDLKDHAEPVTAEAMKEGHVYYNVGAHKDENGYVPFLSPVIFLGRDLEPDDQGMLYFQDVESHLRGVRYGSPGDGAPTRFHMAEVQHPGVYEYEQAIDALLLVTTWPSRTP